MCIELAKFQSFASDDSRRESFHDPFVWIRLSKDVLLDAEKNAATVLCLARSLLDAEKKAATVLCLARSG